MNKIDTVITYRDLILDERRAYAEIMDDLGITGFDKR